MSDISIGVYDGAEVSDLVGLQILSKINEKLPKLNFGLYRDDGIGICESMSSRPRDHTRKRLIALFKEKGLKIINDFGIRMVIFVLVEWIVTRKHDFCAKFQQVRFFSNFFMNVILIVYSL